MPRALSSMPSGKEIDLSLRARNIIRREAESLDFPASIMCDSTQG